jgi:hypothetical protein
MIDSIETHRCETSQGLDGDWLKLTKRRDPVLLSMHDGQETSCILLVGLISSLLLSEWYYK